MSAELYLLRRGEYRIEVVATETGKPLMSKKFTVKGPRTRISLELPPQTLCQLDIRCPAK
jgi:hypothetical protein